MKNEDLGIINDENFNRLRSERNRLLTDLMVVEAVMKRDYPQLFECCDEYKEYFRNKETVEQSMQRSKNTAENLEWIRPTIESVDDVVERIEKCDSNDDFFNMIRDAAEPWSLIRHPELWPENSNSLLFHPLTIEHNFEQK